MKMNPSVRKKREKELTVQMEELSQRFFEGKLDKYHVRITSPNYLGCIRASFDRKRKTIWLIESILNDADGLRRTMIHEMCHYRSDHHGRKFIEELIRIGTLGEPLALEDAKAFQNRFKWNLVMKEMRKDLRLLGVEYYENNGSLPPFSKVLDYISHTGYIDMPPKGLLKRAPWLRQAWKRTKEDVREYCEESLQGRIRRWENTRKCQGES